MRSHAGQDERAAGFTLIEMLIVLAILAVLVAVFAPALSGSRAKTRLAASAQELAIALRATRDAALAESRPETFTLDASSRVYRAGGGAVHGLAPEVDARLVAADANAAGGAIRFFADGGSSGGTVRLSLGKRRLDVSVDWLTGRVSIAGPGG